MPYPILLKFRLEAIQEKSKQICLLLKSTLMLQWLKSKRRFYSGVRREDEARIAMLETRLSATSEA